MRTLLSRLADLVLRRTREERLSEEVRAHLDLLAEEHMARGLSRAEALLAARKSFGGVDQMKERHRDQRGFRLLDELMQDLRYAARLIARDRWFTAATVLALSLGIGATTTMVTILYSMNVRGLPFNEAASLVAVTGEPTRAYSSRVPLAIFEQWRSVARSFEALSAEIDTPINLGDDGRATDQFAGTYLSFNGLSLLGERPLLGREFLPEDDRNGAALVVIIGYRVWTDRYGSDSSVVGRTVRLNGEPATIVGVMPEGFAYPVETQIWRPLASFPGIQQTPQRPIRIVGRLAGGVSAEQARAELAAILSTLTTLPEADRTRLTNVIPLNESYFGKITQALPMMLLAAVVVVLLIACSHAASLLLARSAARSRELSMRSALGAGRSRLIRQLLVESILMSLLAGVFGVGIAAGFVRAFAVEIAAAGLPYWTHFSFDLRLATIITGLCVATGLAFGVLPAFQQSRANLGEVLSQSGRSGMAGPRSRRLTTVLLVGELAVTVVLLGAAAVLVRSASLVYAADAVLNLEHLWEFRMSLPATTYRTGEAQRTFFTALDARAAATPGLHAALAGGSPFNGRDSRGVVMDAQPVPESAALPQTAVVAIGPRYFDTLGLRLVRGAGLEDVDAASRTTVALVNERFAARFSPDVDPIGREVVLINERTPGAPPQRFRIIGIAPPLRQQQQNGHTPAVYVPFLSQPAAGASLIVRGDPRQFAAIVREQVRRLDPDLPVFNLRSLAQVSYMSRFYQRISSFVFSAVAAVATLLSAIGLYSLAAYAASQRTQEIGVRMALGARRSQVTWLFLRQTLTQVSIGLALGMIGAVGAVGALQGVLVDVRGNDPRVLAGIAAFVTLVALAAVVVPARRASRLDPVAALRQD